MSLSKNNGIIERGVRVKSLRQLTHNSTIVKTLLYPAVAARRSLLTSRYSQQKKVISNLGEMIIGDPVIRIDEFSGEFAVDSHSDLFSRIVIYKHYEPQLVKLCMRYFDATRDVIDVGANIGLYTVMFAKHLSRTKVLAIEPTRNAIRRLRRNIEMNGVGDNVEVFEGVASDRNGLVEIKTIRGKEEYSSLGEMNHPSIANEEWVLEAVQSATLDDLVEDKAFDPGFLKVDVEGVENLVFKGAENVLKDKRPIILSELSDFLLRKNGSSAEEVIDRIKAHEYDVVDPVNPSIQLRAKDFGDILCFPKEMKAKAGP
jgi:FkbM family methyltransferase